MRIQFTVTDEELEILTKKAIEGGFPSVTEYCKCSSLQENTSYADLYTTLLNKISSLPTVSYTHLTLPTIHVECRYRWSPYH